MAQGNLVSGLVCAGVHARRSIVNGGLNAMARADCARRFRERMAEAVKGIRGAIQYRNPLRLILQTLWSEGCVLGMCHLGRFGEISCKSRCSYDGV